VTSCCYFENSRFQVELIPNAIALMIVYESFFVKFGTVGGLAAKVRMMVAHKSFIHHHFLKHWWNLSWLAQLQPLNVLLNWLPPKVVLLQVLQVNLSARIQTRLVDPQVILFPFASLIIRLFVSRLVIIVINSASVPALFLTFSI